MEAKVWGQRVHSKGRGVVILESSGVVYCSSMSFKCTEAMEGLATGETAVTSNSRGSRVFSEEMATEVLEGREGGRAASAEEVGGVEGARLGSDHAWLFLRMEAMDDPGMELMLV